MKLTHSFGEVFEVEVISQRGKLIDFRLVFSSENVSFSSSSFSGVSRRLISPGYRSQADCFSFLGCCPGKRTEAEEKNGNGKVIHCGHGRVWAGVFFFPGQIKS